MGTDRRDDERTDYRIDIARHWAAMGPKRALDLLGIKAKADGRGALCCCLWHADSSPSCRVTIGQTGTLRAHCFACSESWDIFAIIAQVHRLDEKKDFREVMRIAAELVGLWDIVDSLEGRIERRERTAPALPPQVQPQEPTYPPRDEVLDLIAACGLCDNDGAVSGWLGGRKLDAHQVDVRALAYALPLDAGRIPQWSQWWTRTGHRLIVPLFDAAGEIRSVRAGTTLPKEQLGDMPKRLAPKGFTSKGLVMADELGREILRGGTWPEWHRGKMQVVISEGEPDWMAWATKYPLGAPLPWACFGVYSGGWTQEHGARIPAGAVVSVRTDLDDAGRRFAEQIKQTLAHCDVRVRTA